MRLSRGNRTPNLQQTWEIATGSPDASLKQEFAKSGLTGGEYDELPRRKKAEKIAECIFGNHDTLHAQLITRKRLQLYRDIKQREKKKKVRTTIYRKLFIFFS
jgi:hypothetical protein